MSHTKESAQEIEVGVADTVEDGISQLTPKRPPTDPSGEITYTHDIEDVLTRCDASYVTKAEDRRKWLPLRHELAAEVSKTPEKKRIFAFPTASNPGAYVEFASCPDGTIAASTVKIASNAFNTASETEGEKGWDMEYCTLARPTETNQFATCSRRLSRMASDKCDPSSRRSDIYTFSQNNFFAYLSNNADSVIETVLPEIRPDQETEEEEEEKEEEEEEGDDGDDSCRPARRSQTWSAPLPKNVFSDQDDHQE